MTFALTTTVPGNAGIIKSCVADLQIYASLRPSTTRNFTFPHRPVGLQQPLKVLRARSERTEGWPTTGLSIEECEAAAVAGNFPDVPPVRRPASPEGTPKIDPLVKKINFQLGFT